MKRRLVKKYSKEAKDPRRSISRARLDYLFRSWTKSFKQLSPVQQWTVATAMQAAFGVIEFTKRLHRLRQMAQPAPGYPQGGVICNLNEGEPIIKPGDTFYVRGERHVME